MFLISSIAAIGASFGWATGIVLAHSPAKKVGAFEFTRIQLIACSAIVALICSGLGYWQTVSWMHWPSYFVSICVGIVLGNLAMMECLRFGGPQRTELLLSLKAPIVGLMAFVWLGETLNIFDVVGIAVVIIGVWLAIVFGDDSDANNNDKINNRGRIIILGLSAAAFQGVGFLIMKPALLAGTEPLAVSAVRLLGAALLISSIALWPTNSFRPKTEMTSLLLVQTIVPGFIGYVVSSSLMLYAYANLEAGIAAVLGSLSPVLVLLVIWIKEQKLPTVPASLGAAIAVSGVCILLLN